MSTVSRGSSVVVRWQAATSEQQARRLRQYVDSLNYFYYLLSQPPGSEPGKARLRPQAQDAEPALGEPEAGMPGGSLDEWSPTFSEHQC